MLTANGYVLAPKGATVGADGTIDKTGPGYQNSGAGGADPDGTNGGTAGNNLGVILGSIGGLVALVLIIVLVVLKSKRGSSDGGGGALNMNALPMKANPMNQVKSPASPGVEMNMVVNASFGRRSRGDSAAADLSSSDMVGQRMYSMDM